MGREGMEEGRKKGKNVVRKGGHKEGKMEGRDRERKEGRDLGLVKRSS